MTERRWVIVRQNGACLLSEYHGYAIVIDGVPRSVTDARRLAGGGMIDYAAGAVRVVVSDERPVADWGEGVYEVDEYGRVGDLVSSNWDST